MTPQSQQIAIAKACGWTAPIGIVSESEDQPFYWKWLPWSWVNRDYKPLWMVSPEETRSYPHTPAFRGVSEVPDYLHDLNAIHEAALTLTPKERAEYCNVLIDVANAYVDFQTVEATAAERCEAFLRVKGLWTGGAIRG